jgi:hypothetical protein
MVHQSIHQSIKVHQGLYIDLAWEVKWKSKVEKLKRTKRTQK